MMGGLWQPGDPVLMTYSTTPTPAREVPPRVAFALRVVEDLARLVAPVPDAGDEWKPAGLEAELAEPITRAAASAARVLAEYFEGAADQ